MTRLAIENTAWFIGLLPKRPQGTCVSYILFENQENAFENVVCEMVSILSRPRYVKSHRGLPSIYQELKTYILDTFPGTYDD